MGDGCRHQLKTSQNWRDSACKLPSPGYSLSRKDKLCHLISRQATDMVTHTGGSAARGKSMQSLASKGRVQLWKMNPDQTTSPAKTREKAGQLFKRLLK